jgi:flavin-dependent dehydrogenase
LTARYREVLAENAPALAGMLETCRLDGRLTAFAGRPGFLRQAAGPGWALVGDAGYFKDPAGAHGMSDALRDAELLSDAIVDGDPDSYGPRRDALSAEMFDTLEQVITFDWTLPELKERQLRMARAMSGEYKVLAAQREARTAGAAA